MISVCIASYNGGRFIERQVKSIITQLDPQDEIVVADDGSTDDTLAILERFNDPRIRIIEGAPSLRLIMLSCDLFMKRMLTNVKRL